MASRGLPSRVIQTVIMRDRFFYPILTQIMKSFFAHRYIPHFVFENIKIFQKILKTLRCDIVTSFKHYNDVTVPCVADVWLLVFHLSNRLVLVCENDLTWVKSTEILIWCREKEISND